ncbi:hypothetical protein [Mucilaginibacter antarcticus]|uniref:hypothetical protein n=1 Tax=Mucilaginibacter antarcticus TaxID=1855725 RepID=UPI0036252B3E
MTPVVASSSTSKRKLSFKEQQELDKLDKEIAETEVEIKKLTDELNSGIGNEAILEMSKKSKI